MKNELTTVIENFNLQTTDRLTNRMALSAQREGSEIIKKVIVANVHEQCRALLAKTALDNIGALSELEAQLTLVSPSGRERYQQIVDSYSLATAQKIWKW